MCKRNQTVTAVPRFLARCWLGDEEATLVSGEVLRMHRRAFSVLFRITHRNRIYKYILSRLNVSAREISRLAIPMWAVVRPCRLQLYSLGTSVNKLTDPCNRKQMKTKWLKQELRGRTNKRANVLTQRLTSLVSWRVAKYITTWFSCSQQTVIDMQFFFFGGEGAQVSVLSTRQYVPKPQTFWEQSISHTV